MRCQAGYAERRRIFRLKNAIIGLDPIIYFRVFLKEKEFLLALCVELFGNLCDYLVCVFVINLASANLMMTAAAIRSAQLADVCLASSVQDAVADGDRNILLVSAVYNPH